MSQLPMSREERAKRREIARDDKMTQLMREVGHSPSKSLGAASTTATQQPGSASPPPPPPLVFDHDAGESRSSWIGELPSELSSSSLPAGDEELSQQHSEANHSRTQTAGEQKDSPAPTLPFTNERGKHVPEQMPKDPPLENSPRQDQEDGKEKQREQDRQRAAAKRAVCKTVETLQRSLLWMGPTTIGTEEYLLQQGMMMDQATGIRTRRMMHETRSQMQTTMNTAPQNAPPATNSTSKHDASSSPASLVDEVTASGSADVSQGPSSSKRRADRRKRQREDGPTEPQMTAAPTSTENAVISILSAVEDSLQSAPSCSSPPNTDDAEAPAPPTAAAASRTSSSASQRTVSLEKIRAAKRRLFHRGPIMRTTLDAEDKCFADLQKLADAAPRAPVATEAQVMASSSFCVADPSTALCNALLRYRPDLILAVARGASVAELHRVAKSDES